MERKTKRRQKRSAAERLAMKLLGVCVGGGGGGRCGGGHLVVLFAWKIPSSYEHYLRNIEI